MLLAPLIGVPMYADTFGPLPSFSLSIALAFMMAITTQSPPLLIMLRR